MTLEVTDGTFEQEVLAADRPVLVDFGATWCGPCRMIAPVVEQIATEHAGKLKVTTLDVDVNPESTSRYGVMSLPTLLVFKGGKAVERIVGYTPKAKLLQALAPHL